LRPMLTFNGLLVTGLFLAGHLFSPTILIWGWARWLRLPKQKTVTSVLSLLGFILATLSALVAVSGMIFPRDWWLSILRSTSYENHGSWRFTLAWQLDLQPQRNIASEFVTLACLCFGDSHTRILARSSSRRVTEHSGK